MAHHDDDDDLQDFLLFQDTAGSDTPDDAETVRCTHCKKWIFEDAEQCPYCKHHQFDDERSRPGLWLILTAILCIFLIGGYLIFYVPDIFPWHLK